MAFLMKLEFQMLLVQQIGLRQNIIIKARPQAFIQWAVNLQQLRAVKFKAIQLLTGIQK